MRPNRAVRRPLVSSPPGPVRSVVGLDRWKSGTGFHRAGSPDDLNQPASRASSGLRVYAVLAARRRGVAVGFAARELPRGTGAYARRRREPRGVGGVGAGRPRPLVALAARPPAGRGGVWTGRRPVRVGSPPSGDPQLVRSGVVGRVVIPRGGARLGRGAGSGRDRVGAARSRAWRGRRRAGGWTDAAMRPSSPGTPSGPGPPGGAAALRRARGVRALRRCRGGGGPCCPGRVGRAARRRRGRAPGLLG